MPLTPQTPLAAWTQVPLLHVSVVQTFPSVQEFALFAVKTQLPFEVLHESSVQVLLSLQMTGFVPTHAPAWQVSVCVQALRSVHGVPLAWKPSAGQAPDVPVQLSATSH